MLSGKNSSLAARPDIHHRPRQGHWFSPEPRRGGRGRFFFVVYLQVVSFLLEDRVPFHFLWFFGMGFSSCLF